MKIHHNLLSCFCGLKILVEGQLLELAYGGGKPGLNLQNIKELIIALPSNEEQKQIIKQVKSLFALADKVEK